MEDLELRKNMGKNFCKQNSESFAELTREQRDL